MFFALHIISNGSNTLEFNKPANSSKSSSFSKFKAIIELSGFLNSWLTVAFITVNSLLCVFYLSSRTLGEISII